jgi:hypothetical protein
MKWIFLKCLPNVYQKKNVAFAQLQFLETIIISESAHGAQGEPSEA